MNVNVPLPAGAVPWEQVRTRLDQNGPFANMYDTPLYRDAVWEQFSEAEYARRYAALRDKMRAHELDCVIWATGFKTNDFMFPMEITGSGGRGLREYWSGGAHAHLGMTIPGFPNLFVMYGPNTNTSGGSIVFYLELQAGYIRQALDALRLRGAGAIDVRPEVELASDRALQARFAGTAWTQCDSWYRDEQGRIVANWPGYMREYRERTERLVASEYRFMPAPDRAQLVGSQE